MLLLVPHRDKSPGSSLWRASHRKCVGFYFSKLFTFQLIYKHRVIYINGIPGFNFQVNLKMHKEDFASFILVSKAAG